MTSQQQPPPYPGFQPYVAQPGYPQQPYPPAGAVIYPQQQPGYPQPAGYPADYPQTGYPAGQPNPGFNIGFVPGPPPLHPSAIPVESPKPEEYSPEAAKDTTVNWKGFSDKAIRAVFVRKVYAILMLQLTFSLGIICLFVFEKHVNRFVRTHMYMYVISYVIFLGVYIALVCCGNLRRKYPTNVYLLSIFTAAMSYMLGTISSFHETKIVLMAVGICAGVCLAVSVFSFHTKFDFTSCGGLLLVLLIVLCLFGIIAIFTRDQIVNTVYAGCGALLFTMFLAYDTHMIMGGKKHELSAEEHIFAAICLYMDVVYIFMFLLMALGNKK